MRVHEFSCRAGDVRRNHRTKKNRRLESAVFLALITIGDKPPMNNQARFTFSSILKTPLGELTNRRLKALPRQRRSRVLRRVRLISAMRISAKNLCHRCLPRSEERRVGEALM